MFEPLLMCTLYVNCLVNRGLTFLDLCYSIARGDCHCGSLLRSESHISKTIAIKWLSSSERAR